MKYKLIASDLDETLLNDDKHVGEKTREAIRKARAKGVLFVPNGGRGYTLIRQTLDEIDALNKPGEYVVSFNGSVITENKNERVIEKTLMDFDLINQLFQIGEDHSLPMHIYCMEEIYVCNLNESEKDYLDRMGFPYQVFDEPSIDFLRDQPLVKMLFMNQDRSQLEALREEVPKDVLDVTTTTYSSNRYLEFNTGGVNKGKGLLQLAKLLDISPEEIIAVGDNSNDLSMIEAAGLGVAVENAIPEIKKAADHVLDCDNNHDSVAELIERFILN
ncbi:Cof-type HAD-IIB family hydrolase [Xylocopilactobacillus apicola]|uniref:Haloacid dehalogenase n=1 Tax=Xylocopilactobacillus apicola TaxID=2932184 RepID=A0AAU9DU24_9LACO|nr:Cof-type HAD-IIB family hydrolase [Xylocopilactobacillus apicola]BDR58958.1 haloacid dehalogenase [Xylocopilactobacillus apicola]